MIKSGRPLYQWYLVGSTCTFTRADEQIFIWRLILSTILTNPTACSHVCDEYTYWLTIYCYNAAERKVESNGYILKIYKTNFYKLVMLSWSNIRLNFIYVPVFFRRENKNYFPLNKLFNNIYYTRVLEKFCSKIRNIRVYA